MHTSRLNRDRLQDVKSIQIAALLDYEYHLISLEHRRVTKMQPS
jgi:hypothetical protein